MRLNLGCGFDRRKGWVNVDRDPACEPDILHDLSLLPWPFESSSADEVCLSHVLEHLGETVGDYLGIIAELYRVCRNEARVHISAPHPRHNDFLVDPTHVRPILPEQFEMFSKRLCEEWVREGYANTPLAISLDVDFEIENVEWTIDEKWRARLQRGEVTSDQLAEMAEHQLNIVKEFDLVLRAIKGPTS